MPAVRSPVGCTAKIARRSLIHFYAFRRLDEAEPRGAYYVVLSGRSILRTERTRFEV